MNKKYYKRFCECVKWQEADKGSGYAHKELYALLEHFPDECPYCHSKLKTRLRGVCVRIEVENELGDSPDCPAGCISLEEFKQLLEKA